MPDDLTPRSVTERVAREGGDMLAKQIMVALNGHTFVQCIYALTHAGVALGLCFDAKDEALRTIDEMAKDMANGIELNWDRRAKLTAEWKASYHPEAGHA